MKQCSSYDKSKHNIWGVKYLNAKDSSQHIPFVNNFSLISSLNYILNLFSLIIHKQRIMNYLEEDYFTNICWIGNFMDSWIQVNDIRRLLLSMKVSCDSLLNIEIKLKIPVHVPIVYLLYCTCQWVAFSEAVFLSACFQ